MANSFFKNGDKAYSENLNDGILVGNAFDLTVDVSLPEDTGEVFPNSSTVVKAKVADVSITPNSNLSIGSSIENSSGSSQVYRLTVYPDFNRFGGFKSITLEGDGTFYIANKGANTPIANNLDYDDLSNVPELKVLKEYDIVVTIPNNGEVTGLGFVFQSSNADVSGSISQSNVTGLGTVITQQDGRLTSLETVNNNIYNYSLSSSEYNAGIDTDVVITCHCTNVSGSDVSGKTLTLKKDGVSVGTANTNSGGVATWTVTCDEWGLHDFRVEDENIQVNVTGWKTNTLLTGFNLKYNESIAVLEVYVTSSLPATFTDFTGITIPSALAPTWNIVSPILNNANGLVAVTDTGNIQRRSATGSQISSTTIRCTLVWHY